MGVRFGSGMATGNKRTANRFLVRWAAAAARKQSGTVPARVYDISGTGLQFGTAEKYRAGDKVPIDVIVGQGVFFRTLVLIMREGGKVGSEYHYGGRFLGTTAVDREILRNKLNAFGDTGDYVGFAGNKAGDADLAAYLGVEPAADAMVQP